MRVRIAAMLCGLTCAGVAAAQALPDYLDIGRAQVRLDRAQEYEEAVKKLVDANRKHNGIQWLALQVQYGDTSGFLFVSSFANLAGVEKGMGDFMGAIEKGLGPIGSGKLMRDMSVAAPAWHTELRRRRWDLSVNAPTNGADFSRMVGQSRWVRALRIDLKPGKMAEFTAAWKDFQSELSRMQPKVTVLMSESVTGTTAAFAGMYIKSLGELDVTPALQKAVASDAYQNLQRVTSNTANLSTWEIYRIRPELSNPPDEVVSADPGFWRPKPPAPPKPKTEAAPQKK